jgi:hypothetical protein
MSESGACRVRSFFVRGYAWERPQGSADSALRYRCGPTGGCAESDRRAEPPPLQMCYRLRALQIAEVGQAEGGAQVLAEF